MGLAARKSTFRDASCFGFIGIDRESLTVFFPSICGWFSAIVAAGEAGVTPGVSSGRLRG
jgi:hypothetical protein